ncbi:MULTISPECIES: minor capsid protein [Staphylococcus]|uniref:minor capsid protein n=1 Tax=Staphylococcus TaxID=1279 RepID=UPI00076B5663|nr:MULTISPECIES: minor capsid protein [Staphylococcus]AMG63430.1 phage head morphogenesis protein [Staphylococcus lugdunensis]MCI2815868.1 minor capsid protein [Staphylococcus lugdunensis]MDU0967443.1 minor capsid protein [Staphylococcus lugdunensis]MDU1965363.1 minor capsid protein [Staphylococcus lugdunensis]MDU2323064.1 minor capsid protein [Staphylococcus lugdunensis]
MPNNIEYWLERAQNVINAESLADAQAAIELERLVIQMYAEISKELLAFYAKYALDTGLNIQEVKKKADEFDVLAFRNKAKQYVERKDFSDEANKALKLYNLSMKVSREQLLKQQLDLIIKSSGSDLQDKIEEKLVEAVDREVERQAHILGEHVKIDDTEISAVVNSNFKGVKWSTRLWKDMAVVQKEVERVTSNVVVRGRHPNEYISDFKKKTDATTYNAKCLLITESARVQSESQKLTYLKELGQGGEYKYVAKIDNKTSKICHSLNGKVFKVKDMVPGINAPPMHPWCRSTTVPHVGNWRDKFFKERKGKYKTSNGSNSKKQSGALNDLNNPYHLKRDKHAIKYYKSVLNRNKKREIEIISNNTGYNQKLIERVYEHLFENIYELGNKKEKFFPDFNIALSWQRLREGKNIKEQDFILLRHEALEHYLMNKYNYSYTEAHNYVEKKYDYASYINK